MSIYGAEPLIQRLVANQCDCGAGILTDVKPGIERYEFPYEIGMVPGLTHQETAILAGVLTGLATFLFLALPILCCLCPCLPCMCCFGSSSANKKAAAAAAAAETLEKSHVSHLRDNASIRSTDVESMISFNSFDKTWQDKTEKWDFEDLHEVDMKIPRVWMDTLRGVPDDEIDAKLQELQAGGWEGMDFRHSDLDAHMDGGMSGQVVMAGNHSLGRQSANMMSESAMRESSNVEQYTEYETTREINFQAVASNLPEHEYIYERDLRQEMDTMDKDNFMKIYWKYRKYMDDSKRTAF